MTHQPPPPAGWYPDPDGGAGMRYWTGSSWAPAQQATAPTPARQAEASAPAPGASENEKRGWNKKLTAIIATATAAVGLVSGVVALSKDLFGGGDSTPPPAAAPAVPAEAAGNTAMDGELTPLTAEKLDTGVQFGSYQSLLGEPISRARLQNDEWLVSTWATPDIRVDAFSDQNDQVVAYTLTSLGPGFTPVIKYLAGGIRLRNSVFADTDTPSSAAGVYPPNARYSYEEYHQGATATGGKSVVLAASFAANADDAAATEISAVQDCLDYSVFENGPGCPADRLEKLRSGLHITSATVGDSAVLEALAGDGAQFFPSGD